MCSLVVMTHVTQLKFILNFPEEKQTMRKAITIGPLLEQEYFVGEVNVCMLEVVAELPNNLKRYKVSQITNIKSWQSLERLLHNASITSRYHGKPMEWVWGETNTILP
jgi:hypothetical protein